MQDKKQNASIGYQHYFTYINNRNNAKKSDNIDKANLKQILEGKHERKKSKQRVKHKEERKEY